MSTQRYLNGKMIQWWRGLGIRTSGLKLDHHIILVAYN